MAIDDSLGASHRPARLSASAQRRMNLQQQQKYADELFDEFQDLLKERYPKELPEAIRTADILQESGYADDPVAHEVLPVAIEHYRRHLRDTLLERQQKNLTIGTVARQTDATYPVTAAIEAGIEAQIAKGATGISFTDLHGTKVHYFLQHVISLEFFTVED